MLPRALLPINEIDHCCFRNSDLVANLYYLELAAVCKLVGCVATDAEHLGQFGNGYNIVVILEYRL